METIDRLTRRIATTAELQDMVRLMKAIAAVSIRQYLKAVASLAEYHRTVEMGFHMLVRQQPEPRPPALAWRGRTGAVIFGSEMGMCGQFNEQIADFARNRLKEEVPAPRDRLLMVAGHRVRAALEEEGETIQEYVPVPGTVNGIGEQVRALLLKVDDWQERQGVERLLLFHHRLISGSRYEPVRVQVLPVDLSWLAALKKTPWPTRVLPTFTMAPERLFSALFRQFLFVSLFQAFAESLASENAARLAAMQAAEENIAAHLQEMRLAFNQLRQSSITEELLDIVAGYQALRDTT